MKKQTKLLCIDDDRSLIEMIGKFFERLDYNVFTAGDGEEGLEIFHAQKPGCGTYLDILICSC